MVEVVAPEHYLPVVNVEPPADPELDVQSANLQNVRALGQHRWTVSRDGVHVDLEPRLCSGERGTKDLSNTLTPVDSRQPDICILHVHRQQLNRPIDVTATKEAQELLDHLSRRRTTLIALGDAAHHLTMP